MNLSRIFLPLTQILLIVNEGHSAPKLGGVLFEQLFLETFIDDGNNTNKRYKRKRINIKNTTSIYAKLTGNSMRNAATFGSEHKYKEIKEQEHATRPPNTTANTSITNSSVFNESTSTVSMSKSISSSSPTTPVILKNASYTSDLVKLKVGKAIITREKVKIKTIRKSTPKEYSVSSKLEKNRRDGAMLQLNGYAFNEDICQMTGDRVLCGYNNQGPPIEPPVARNDDCVLRGDRVECGYSKPMDNSKRRNNKQKNAKQNESETLNVTTNFTGATTITSNTSYSATTTKLTTLTTIPEILTTGTSSSNILPQNDKPNLSVYETQKVIDRVEKMMASIIMHSKTINASPSTTTVTNTPLTITNNSFSTITPEKASKISDDKIQDLIDRVDKLIASIVTNSTSAGTTPGTESVIEKKLSKALELLSRIEKLRLFADTVSASNTTTSLATTASTNNSVITSSSPEIPTNTTSTTISIPTTPNLTTVNTSTTTNFTTTSSTVSPTTTTIGTTTEAYIDEREYCVEKDGRIVCYDNIDDYYSQEEYDNDSYLVK